MTQLEFIEALRRRKLISITTYEVSREYIDELDFFDWLENLVYNIDSDKKEARNAARRAARAKAKAEKMNARSRG